MRYQLFLHVAREIYGRHNRRILNSCLAEGRDGEVKKNGKNVKKTISEGFSSARRKWKKGGGKFVRGNGQDGQRLKFEKNKLRFAQTFDTLDTRRSL